MGADSQRRKWRPTDVRKAELETRRRRLERSKRQVEARIAKLDPRDHIAARKRETRANIVLGAVLRAHALLNPVFGAALGEILDANLRRPADRQLLGAVLGMTHLAAPQTPVPENSPTLQRDLRHLASDIVNRRTVGPGTSPRKQ